ncbi:CubicO group peptidase (beta-lactamase class C family) [Povalibacter uvarum]|uniref:CubicO group peptidase (Beta-lactamase class C family) n=1 Tax=Povalibacter uvarum TaxID=732238 RepID=A0A841HSF9_9GAMM|nr:serine hydrolase domain-containing protein [Povalibacter uvarum]MBB6095826.1 CubicO group peptidase (beta-lactamase class C family) [Povalibacter uvarum]
MNHRNAFTRRSCIARLAATLLPLPSLARAATVSAPPWPALQNVLDEFVIERSAVGTSVAVARSGTAAYLDAGRIAFDSPEPFDENSICRIYSMTKNVTRIATLLLVEDGKLSLEQPVAEVLPEFRNLRVAIDIAKGLESRPVTRVMTMRHLITNTSGLGNWTPGSDSGDALHRLYRERGITPGSYGTGRTRPGYGAQPATLDEMVARVAELPLAFEPGTTLHYSIGFDVMALVIERVTGISYDAFLQKRLFEPLQMHSTGFQVKPHDARRLTTNYDATERQVNSAEHSAQDPALPAGWRVQDDRAGSDWLKPPHLLAGGGGLVSTSRDFLRYAQMLLDEGALGSTRIMKVDTARMAVGNINPPNAAEPDEGVGAGTRAMLRTPLIPPGTIGGGGATGTLFWIDPKHHTAAVFMVQVMYGGPARSPFQKRLFAAIDQDMASA